MTQTWQCMCLSKCSLCSIRKQTFDLQVKRAAIKFVFVGDLTSVIPCIVLLRLNDVHLKGVDLQGKTMPNIA